MAGLSDSNSTTVHLEIAASVEVYYRTPTATGTEGSVIVDVTAVYVELGALAVNLSENAVAVSIKTESGNVADLTTVNGDNTATNICQATVSALSMNTSDLTTVYSPSTANLTYNRRLDVLDKRTVIHNESRARGNLEHTAVIMAAVCPAVLDSGVVHHYLTVSAGDSDHLSSSLNTAIRRSRIAVLSTGSKSLISYKISIIILAIKCPVVTAVENNTAIKSEGSILAYLNHSTC